MVEYNFQLNYKKKWRKGLSTSQYLAPPSLLQPNPLLSYNHNHKPQILQANRKTR